jgi:hypothetical protein
MMERLLWEAMLSCVVSGNVVSVDAVLVPNVIADVQLGWDDKFLGANMLNLVSE